MSRGVEMERTLCGTSAGASESELLQAEMGSWAAKVQSDQIHDSSKTVSVLYLAHLFTITRTVGIRIGLHDRSTSTVRVKVWRITEKSTHNLENTSLFRCYYTSQPYINHLLFPKARSHCPPGHVTIVRKSKRERAILDWWRKRRKIKLIKPFHNSYGTWSVHPFPSTSSNRAKYYIPCISNKVYGTFCRKLSLVQQNRQPCHIARIVALTCLAYRDLSNLLPLT